MRRSAADPDKLGKLVNALRASDRVKASVKEKSDGELLDHYQLAQGDALTNLGVLCLGRQHHRAQLTTAPVIQFIKYDEHGQKVNNLVWDDHTLNPMELIEAIWLEIPDFRERYELPDGLYRQNVLHTTVRRNEHLARLFHDLKLMEREGSGFDKIFEVLLSQGRPAPELIETHDRVQVTVRRRILQPEVIDFIPKADQTYQLTQRERIALGLLAQGDAMTARELAAVLELSSVETLQPWIKRLLDWELIQSAGRTQATRYFVETGLLRTLHFVGGTTLKRIVSHRLSALIVEEVGRYPGTKIGDIHLRVGIEIPRSRVRRAVEQLVKEGNLSQEGVRSDTRYRLP